jgi:hypothetical protein
MQFTNSTKNDSAMKEKCCFTTARVLSKATLTTASKRKERKKESE